MATKQSQPRQPGLLDRRIHVDRLPGPVGLLWRFYQLDTADQNAEDDFQRRFGVQPEHVLVYSLALVLGPVPAEVQP